MNKKELKHESNALYAVLCRLYYSTFKKVFTHNYCDTCGFTKDEVYITEIYIEAGIIQCDKCSGR